MKFEKYWEEKGHLGCDPEEVAKLAWDAAREDAFSAERKECAKIADQMMAGGSDGYRLACDDIAALIRARGAK